MAELRRLYGEEATTCRVPPVGPLSSLEAYAEHGADLTKRTTEGWTPHDVAAMKGKAAVVEYLESLPSASTATPA